MDANEVTEPARPDALEEPPVNRAPLSADPGMPERFREVVRPLDEIDAQPVATHPEAYDAVHRELRSRLDDVDRSG